MATQTLRPNAITTQTGCSGAYTALQNDPDSGTDGNWVTADSDNGDIVLVVTFPAANGALLAGAGLQEIRALVACSDTGNTPDNVTMELWEGDPSGSGSLITTLVNAADPTYGAGTVISGTWNSADLTDETASSDVRVRITCTADTSPTPQICSLDVDSVEWNASYTPNAQTVFPVAGLGTIPRAPASSAQIVIPGFGVVDFEVAGGPVTGTGDLASGAATIEGTGTVTAIGTGTLQADAATIDGTGTVTSAGTGSLQADASTISGTGTVTATGTGDLQASASTIDGTGTVTAFITGTGSLQASAATIDGAGTVTITGTGTLQSDAAVIDGAGTVGDFITGTGGLQSSSAIIDGAGTVTIAGTGSLQVDTATIDGTGTITITGTGTLQSDAAIIDGVGTVGDFISGTGDLQSSSATIDGTGVVTITGTGSLQVDAATITASGTVTGAVTGTGTLQADAATITGSGAVTELITGTGALVAGAAVIAGIGTIGRGEWVPAFPIQTNIETAGLSVPSGTALTGTWSTIATVATTIRGGFRPRYRAHITVGLEPTATNLHFYLRFMINGTPGAYQYSWDHHDPGAQVTEFTANMDEAGENSPWGADFTTSVTVTVEGMTTGAADVMDGILELEEEL